MSQRKWVVVRPVSPMRAAQDEWARAEALRDEYRRAVYGPVER